jgi:hypothetical protein
VGIEVGMVEEDCDGAGDCEGEFSSDIMSVLSKRTLIVEEIRECKDRFVCATVRMVVMDAEEKYKNS